MFLGNRNIIAVPEKLPHQNFEKENAW